MSLDLFFVNRTPSFAALRADDFAPTPAQQKARRKLVAEFLAEHAGTSLAGDPLHGRIDGMPGEMELRPGCIFWSMKGADSEEDIQTIQDVVDWFKTHGLVCEDVQEAGFGNRRPKAVEKLASLDALVGSQLQAVNFDRNCSTALRLDWILADGRMAHQKLAHFESCGVPQLAPLVKARVASVDVIEGGIFDEITVRFDSGHQLRIGPCVPDTLTVSGKRSQSMP